MLATVPEIRLGGAGSVQAMGGGVLMQHYFGELPRLVLAPARA